MKVPVAIVFHGELTPAMKNDTLGALDFGALLGALNLKTQIILKHSR